MDQIVQDTLSDRVRVSGRITAMTLTGDGRLRWTDGHQRSLTLEKHVLGFVVEGGKIRIRAVVDGRDEICCGGRAGSVVRKDFVFEPLSEDSKRLWCEKIRDFIDSFGKFMLLLLLFCTLFNMLMWYWVSCCFFFLVKFVCWIWFEKQRKLTAMVFFSKLSS